MNLQSQIYRQGCLTKADRQEMLQLHCRYFANVAPGTFFSDLEQKQWVIMLRNGSELGGFSTLQILTILVDGRETLFLFSGDTVVDRACRNYPALAGCFGHLILKGLDIAGNRELYWFLISKGYRTYRFLPVFFNEFYPRFDMPTPHSFQKALDAAAQFKFGDSYDAPSGIIRTQGAKDHLKPVMQQVAPGRMRDPHIDFFFKKNPGHVVGDELACITALRRDNLNRSAWRSIRTTPVSWVEHNV